MLTNDSASNRPKKILKRHCTVISSPSKVDSLSTQNLRIISKCSRSLIKYAEKRLIESSGKVVAK